MIFSLLVDLFTFVLCLGSWEHSRGWQPRHTRHLRRNAARAPRPEPRHDGPPVVRHLGGPAGHRPAHLDPRHPRRRRPLPSRLLLWSAAEDPGVPGHARLLLHPVLQCRVRHLLIRVVHLWSCTSSVGGSAGRTVLRLTSLCATACAVR